MTYQAEAVIDGNPVVLRKDYTCHYEAWPYEDAENEVYGFAVDTLCFKGAEACRQHREPKLRGPEWHDREGWDDISVWGAFTDGTVYELVPDDLSWSNQAAFCPLGEKPPLPSRLFMRRDDFSVESFDATHTKSDRHVVQLGEARMISRKTRLRLDWGASRDKTVAGRMYHSVSATVIPGSVWRGNLELVAMVTAKRVVWLERDAALTQEQSDAEQKTIRELCEKDSKIKAYMERTEPLPFEWEGGRVWKPTKEPRHAIQWVDESTSGVQRFNPKFIVVYAGAALPLSPLYGEAFVFVPEKDALVIFRSSTVKLRI